MALEGNSNPMVVNIEFARKARSGPAGDGHDYDLIAGTDSVALMNERGSGSIDDIDHALSGLSVGFQDCAGPNKDSLRVYGILPNGAANALLHLIDKSDRPLDVVGNVYVELVVKSASALPDGINFDIDGVTKSVVISRPPDILDPCASGPADGPSTGPSFSDNGP